MGCDALVEMCGPRDVAVGSPTTTAAGGEGTGQDKSSASGIFVLTVEHVHGGSGVMIFMVFLALTLALIWCCARKGLSWCCRTDRGSAGSRGPEGDGTNGKGSGPGTPGWLPSLA